MNRELVDRLQQQMSDEGLAFDGFPIEASADEILVEENMETFTEDDVKALVEKAVAEATQELQAKLDEVEAAKKELETKDAEATIANLNEEIKDLQAKLDTAVLEVQNEKAAREEQTSYLEAVKAEAEAEAEIARRTGERKAKVAEVATFPEEYLEANADRWARMSEEDFEAAVADYAAVSKKESKSDVIPEAEALTASRETKQDQSARSAVFSMRLKGVDARNVL